MDKQEKGNVVIVQGGQRIDYVIACCAQLTGNAHTSCCIAVMVFDR